MRIKMMADPPSAKIANDKHIGIIDPMPYDTVIKKRTQAIIAVTVRMVDTIRFNLSITFFGYNAIFPCCIHVTLSITGHPPLFCIQNHLDTIILSFFGTTTNIGILVEIIQRGR